MRVTYRGTAGKQLQAALRGGGFLDIFEKAIVQPEQNRWAGMLLGFFVDSSESVEGEAGRGYG